MQDNCKPIEVRGLNKSSRQTMRWVASIVVLACKETKIDRGEKEKTEIKSHATFINYDGILG
jgi:hypothetical protein